MKAINQPKHYFQLYPPPDTHGLKFYYEWPGKKEGVKMAVGIPEAKKINVLPQAEAIKLAQWMTDRKERILIEKPTMPTLAAAATGSLGFNVTRSNIRSMRDSLGIPAWHNKKLPKELPQNNTRTSVYEAELQLLAGIVRNTRLELGLKISPLLIDLCEDVKRLGLREGSDGGKPKIQD